MIRVWMLLVVSSLFLFGSIIGSWQIDQTKTKKENAQVDASILSSTMFFFSFIDIYDNHTFLCKKVDFKAKWEKEGGRYVVVNGEDKTLLYQLSDMSIKILVKTVDGATITLFYKRVTVKKRIK